LKAAKQQTRAVSPFGSHARETARAHAHTMATATKTKNTITLKGSAQIVSQFFGYAVNR